MTVSAAGNRSRRGTRLQDARSGIGHNFSGPACALLGVNHTDSVLCARLCASADIDNQRRSARLMISLPVTGAIIGLFQRRLGIGRLQRRFISRSGLRRVDDRWRVNAAEPGSPLEVLLRPCRLRHKSPAAESRMRVLMATVKILSVVNIVKPRPMNAAVQALVKIPGLTSRMDGGPLNHGRHHRSRHMQRPRESWTRSGRHHVAATSPTTCATPGLSLQGHTGRAGAEHQRRQTEPAETVCGKNCMGKKGLNRPSPACCR